MPIDFLCPHCNHRTLVSDEFAGQTGPCANCDSAITIPGVPLGSLGQTASENPYAAPIKQDFRPSQFEDSKESDAGLRMLIPVDRSALAIVAGYLGLFSVIVFPAPFAFLLGVLALRDIKKSGGKKHGKGRAWFAIVMGATCSLAALIGILAAASG